MRSPSRLRAIRIQRAEAFLVSYEKACIAEGLDPYTQVDEFVGHLIAKGAYNLLSVMCRDESKLAYDPDARLHASIRDRLELADRVMRKAG